MAGALEGSLVTIDVEHAAHVRADARQCIQFATAVDEESMDCSGGKRVNGTVGHVGQACDRHPPSMSPNQGGCGPGHSWLDSSLQADSRHQAGGKGTQSGEDGTAACHRDRRREEASMQALDKLGRCLLAATAPEQLHEPEHAAVLIREAGDPLTRRAIGQHSVDRALEAFFLAHRVTPYLIGKRHPKREAIPAQAARAVLIVDVFLFALIQ